MESNEEGEGEYAQNSDDQFEVEKYNAMGDKDEVVSLLAPQSLELVHRLPVISSSYVKAKVVRPDSTKAECGWMKKWAEIRGGVLLLSPSKEIKGQHRSDDRTAFDLVYYRAKSDRKTLTLERPAHKIKGVAKQFALNYSDFEILKIIGKGAYGRVYMTRSKNGSDKLAVKVIEKSVIEADDYLFQRVVDERAVLEKVGYHPYVLRLYYAFESAQRLFFVTEFVPKGDLFSYLIKRGQALNEDACRALMAELILALEHIHSLDVVYRDLKPENILLDDDGHIRLADFGLAKILADNSGQARQTSSICGTREYFAPEMLERNYGRSVDLWSLGIFMYYMLVGVTPFESDDPEELLDKVSYAEIDYPDFLSSESKSLLQALLTREPKRRMGVVQGIGQLKTHAFFKGVNFDDVLNRKCNSLFAYEDDNQQHQVPMKMKSAENRQLLPTLKAKRGKGKAHHSIAGFSYMYPNSEGSHAEKLVLKKSRVDLKVNEKRWFWPFQSRRK